MRRAVIADCLQLGSVVTLDDSRLSEPVSPATVRQRVSGPIEERARFLDCASSADWTIVIAPEFHGLLATRAGWVVEASGKLLGPSPEFIALAANKHRSAAVLAAAGVPVPPGWPLADLLGDSTAATRRRLAVRFPAVLKPADGCGSESICRVDSWDEIATFAPQVRDPRLETFEPGMAASIAVLSRAGTGCRPLPACRQRLSNDGRFQYLGGETPLPAPFAVRAERLAHAACRAFPPTIGYWGLDLVLGDSPGEGDYVIEVNPRLTTSYLGLRKLAGDGNLVAAMIRLAAGEEDELSFHTQPVQFTP